MKVNSHGFRLCKRGILPELLISRLDFTIKSKLLYLVLIGKSINILSDNKTILANGVEEC